MAVLGEATWVVVRQQAFKSAAEAPDSITTHFEVALPKD
jgi:hypothetical protein